MTPQEFKAWFDGFTEALSGVPTKAQWARIKDRVSEIDGQPTTERIYVDRYWPVYNGWPNRFYSTCNTMGGSAVGLNSGSSTSIQNAGYAGMTNAVSLSAMGDLGRAEAAAIAA